MKYLVCIYLCIALICSSLEIGLAQEGRCTIELAQAPEIRLLRLGMTIDEVMARYPSIKIPPADEFGLAKHVMGSSTLIKLDPTAFKGIERIRLVFVDKRLVEFAVTYSDSIPWGDVDRFSSRISEALHLPNSWKQSGEPTSKYLECEGFLIEASFYNGEPGITFRDAKGLDIVKKRMAEKKERQIQAFKP